MTAALTIIIIVQIGFIIYTELSWHKTFRNARFSKNLSFLDQYKP